MKSLVFVLLSLLLGVATARASVDLSAGSFYRTAGVPAWSAGSGTFTVMLWVYAPAVSGYNDFFEADNGAPLSVYIDLGSAADSPTEPFFLTPAGEWHYNKDGSSTANPAQSFDVTQGWTFLAVSFTSNGSTDLYAWQAGVNGDKLVHISAQTAFSSIGGSGSTNTFTIGNQSGFGEGCICLLGPLYVYEGVALSQAQVDAQRQQLAPVEQSNLIAYSTFVDAGTLDVDQSGTANWSVHGSPALNNSNPPVSASASSGGSGGSSGAGSSSGSSSSSSSSSSSGGGSSSSSGSSSSGSSSGSSSSSSSSSSGSGSSSSSGGGSSSSSSSSSGGSSSSSSSGSSSSSSGGGSSGSSSSSSSSSSGGSSSSSSSSSSGGGSSSSSGSGSVGGLSANSRGGGAITPAGLLGLLGLGALRRRAARHRQGARGAPQGTP